MPGKCFLREREFEQRPRHAPLVLQRVDGLHGRHEAGLQLGAVQEPAEDLCSTVQYSTVQCSTVLTGGGEEGPDSQLRLSSAPTGYTDLSP